MPDGGDQVAYYRVMSSNTAFQFSQLMGQALVRGKNLAQPHEGANNVNAHFDRPAAVRGRWPP